MNVYIYIKYLCVNSDTRYTYTCLEIIRIIKLYLSKEKVENFSVY